jgi:hypothetical protein
MAYTTIDDPSAYFHIELYTGNGDARNITNDANAGDFKPDLLWIKERTSTSNHMVMDSSRAGDWNRLNPNLNSAEITTDPAVLGITDGFSLSASDNGLNEDTETYVAWQWKANGGSTTTNDASATGVGSIDSVYQANTTAGFSIVTYTGTGSTATVAHGLGGVPDMLLFKKRSTTDNWYMYHSANTSAPETDYMTFDTNAATTDFNIWNDTAPTSTVFSISNAGVHADTTTMVCYAFRSIQGYSKFGSYTGNGNADGPFVYTGFKPAFILHKQSSGTQEWQIRDNKRDTYNETSDTILHPDLTNADTTSTTNVLDFLSNGFKAIGTGAGTNEDGQTYIYAAFAEQPFVTSGGVPCTAR